MIIVSSIIQSWSCFFFCLLACWFVFFLFEWSTFICIAVNDRINIYILFSSLDSLSTGLFSWRALLASLSIKYRNQLSHLEREKERGRGKESLFYINDDTCAVISIHLTSYELINFDLTSILSWLIFCATRATIIWFWARILALLRAFVSETGETIFAVMVRSRAALPVPHFPMWALDESKGNGRTRIGWTLALYNAEERRENPQWGPDTPFATFLA